MDNMLRKQVVQVDTAPCLSVVVAVYNKELYLVKCVDSILKQDYRNIEVILVDDGSSDNSGSICDDYARVDKRVRVFHTENNGAVAARRYGVQQATSELVIMPDADDELEGDMFSSMMAYYNAYKPDIVCSGYRWCSDGGKLSMDLMPEGYYDRSRIVSEIIPKMMYDKRGAGLVLPTLCTKIFRRELLLQSMEGAGNRIKLGEDAAVCYICLAQAESVYFTGKAWYNYWRHEDCSMCCALNGKTFEEIKYFQDYMEAKCKELQLWHCMEQQVLGYTGALLSFAIQSMYRIEMTRYKYLFPFDRVKKGTKLAIYGAGKVGAGYMNCLRNCAYATPVLWVDKNYRKIISPYGKVDKPEELLTAEFDVLLIAAAAVEIADDIKEKLAAMGIPETKMLWVKPEII